MIVQTSNGTGPTGINHAIAELRQGSALEERVAMCAEGLDGLTVTLADLTTMKLSNPRYLVQDILQAGGLGIIGGEPGAGKTWLGCAMAVAVASGCALFGRYDIPEAGRALYVANEGTVAGIRARLCALARGMGIEPANLDTLDVIVGKVERAQLDGGLLDKLKANGCRYTLVVVDTLAASWSGDENSARDVAKLVRQLRELCQLGATVLLLHHSSKATDANKDRRPGQRLRGSSVLHGARDSLLMLDCSKDAIRTTVTVEQKEAGLTAPFTFSWPDAVTANGTAILDFEAGATSHTHAGKPGAKRRLRDAILAHVSVSPGCSKNCIDNAIAGTRKTIFDAVDSMVAAGVLELRDHGYHTGGSGTTSEPPEPPELEGVVPGSTNPFKGVGNRSNHPAATGLATSNHYRHPAEVY